MLRYFLLCIVFLFPFALAAEEVSVSAAVELARDVDILWVTISAALVFFMQAGFLMLESGLVRAKNTINVAIKNLIDYIAGSLGYFVIGFGLMFGTSISGIMGRDLFLLNGYESGQEYAFFLFQIAFMGTAATIVSGAVAERIKFHSYLIISIVISVFIYPVFGHWVWGGGWLAQMGFVDFAGSTVVHSVGGWIGLAGAIVLGPRKDKYTEDGKLNHIYGHDLPLSVLGTLILWLGWFGFNGGSTLVLDDTMPRIIVNTSLAACAGGCSALVLSWGLTGFTRAGIEDIINGVIGGLVAITAACHVVTPASSVLIGLVAGVIVVLNVRLMDHVLKIDDVVGAFTVHALCGIWGTLAVSFFGGSEAAPFLIQLLGVAVCALWSFSLGFAFFMLFKLFGVLRVTPDSEDSGLNMTEHGARTTWLDLVSAMSSVAEAKGLPEKIDVEYGSESGAVATLFNQIVENISGMVTTVDKGVVTINSISSNLNNSAEVINRTITDESARLQNISAMMHEVTDAVTRTSTLSEELRESAIQTNTLSESLLERFNLLNDELNHSTKHTMDGHSFSLKGEEDLMSSVDGMRQIESSSAKVREVAGFLVDISEQLNLLSLNASIEAARWGDEGKGFSVIANEINILSDTTLNHTKEAAKYTEEIQHAVAGGASSLMTTVDSFKTIRNEISILKRIMNMLMEESDSYKQMVSRINSYFHETNAKVSEISSMMQQRSKEISGVFSVIWDVNSSLEKLQLRASELNDSSRELADSSGAMYSRVRTFKQ